jgi:hypothetical protein
MTRSISEQETAELISYIEEGSSSNVDSKKEYDYWAQPDNQIEPCLLFIQDSNDAKLPDGAKLYWDGACKDGRAYGLGRSFLRKDGSIQATLEEYKGGLNKPTSYYASDFSKNIYVQGDIAGRKLLVVQVNDVADFDMGVLLINMDGAVTYTKTSSLAGDTTVLGKSFGGAPNNGYFIQTKNYPNGQYQHSFYTKKGGSYVGYAINIDSSGETHLWLNNGAWERVYLPQSYVSRASMIAAEIVEKLAVPERYAADAGKALNRYQEMVCRGEQPPSFLDIKMYGQICSKNGDITVFNEKAEKVVAHKIEIKQQQMVQEAARQHLAAENAAMQAQGIAQLIGGIAGIGASMNNAGQAALSQSPAYQAQPPNIPSSGLSSQKKSYGAPVYSGSECTGSVIMGRCTGAVIPSSSSRERCYGSVVNGNCIGPQF